MKLYIIVSFVTIRIHVFKERDVVVPLLMKGFQDTAR